MRFPLTAEQADLQARVRTLADGDFRERAAGWDEREEYPWENVKTLVKEGLMGMAIPREYGGQGSALLDVILAIEAAARTCGITGRLLVDSNLGPVGCIVHYGTEAQKRTYLPRVVQGDKPAIAITEHRAGSAASDMETAITPDGDGWVINGSQALDHRRRRVADLRRLRPLRRDSRGGGHRRRHRGGRHARAQDRQAREGHGDARHPRGRDGLRRLPRARRQPHLQGRRLQEADGRLQRPAPRRGHGGPRPGPGGLRAGREVRRRARAIRTAHRALPGAALAHRRHGHADRVRAPDDLPHRRQRRPRPPRRHRGRHVQGAGERDGREGHQRRAPDLRGHRLLARDAAGAHGARRADVHDRRRHRANFAQRGVQRRPRPHGPARA